MRRIEYVVVPSLPGEPHAQRQWDQDVRARADEKHLDFDTLQKLQQLRNELHFIKLALCDRNVQLREQRAELRLLRRLFRTVL